MRSKKEQIRVKWRVDKRNACIEPLESNLSKEKCNIWNVQVRSSNDDVGIDTCIRYLADVLLQVRVGHIKVGLGRRVG